jgi:pyrrolidone-carboxylate peptidase
MIQPAHVGFLHVPIKIGTSIKLVRNPNLTAKTLVEETTLLINPLIRHFFLRKLTRA